MRRHIPLGLMAASAGLMLWSLFGSRPDDGAVSEGWLFYDPDSGSDWFVIGDSRYVMIGNRLISDSQLMLLGFGAAGLIASIVWWLIERHRAQTEADSE